MDDNKSIISQVHDLLVLVSGIKDLKVEVFESLQVVAILLNFPPLGMIIERNDCIHQKISLLINL
jgi:hypothetical protein